MSTVDTTRLRALAEAATPGPWDWYGNARMTDVYLATVRGGRNHVMDFVRWGMRSAKPRFNICGIMRTGKELATGERFSIDHPDASYIAAMDPTTVLALLDEVERLRARLAALEPSPAPEFSEDTRDWYWREDDNEATPNGPYPTREAALADVPGYYAVGEMPERVLVGRCTDPLSLVTLNAEDVREVLRDRLMDIADMDVSIHDEPRADDALEAWISEYVVCEWEWVTDPKEEWVYVGEPEEGGTP